MVENTFGKLNSKSETVQVNFSVILSIDITSSQRLFPQRPLMALLLAMIVADDDSDDNSGVSYNELLVILTEWLKEYPGRGRFCTHVSSKFKSSFSTFKVFLIRLDWMSLILVFGTMIIRDVVPKMARTSILDPILHSF